MSLISHELLWETFLWYILFVKLWQETKHINSSTFNDPCLIISIQGSMGSLIIKLKYLYFRFNPTKCAATNMVLLTVCLYVSVCLTVSPCCWGLEVADWLCGENWDSCCCCRELKMRGPVGIWRCTTQTQTKQQKGGVTDDEGRGEERQKERNDAHIRRKRTREEGNGRIKKPIKQHRVTRH